MSERYPNVLSDDFGSGIDEAWVETTVPPSRALEMLAEFDDRPLCVVGKQWMRCDGDPTDVHQRWLPCDEDDDGAIEHWHIRADPNAP